MTEIRTINLTVNGVAHEAAVEVRKTLVDFLREDLDLVGTHVGCEHGVCGACTILLDGVGVRSCLMLAVQAGGAQITTIEGIAPAPDRLHPIQEAFWEEHGLQCGFCTPGFVISTYELLRRNPDPTIEEIKDQLGGHLCRCTGYQAILESVLLAARKMSGEAAAQPPAANAAASEPSAG